MLRGTEAETSGTAKHTGINPEKNIQVSGRKASSFLFFSTGTVFSISGIDSTNISWAPPVSGRSARILSITRCGPHPGRADSLMWVRELQERGNRRGGSSGQK